MEPGMRRQIYLLVTNYSVFGNLSTIQQYQRQQHKIESQSLELSYVRRQIRTPSDYFSSGVQKSTER